MNVLCDYQILTTRGVWILPGLLGRKLLPGESITLIVEEHE